MTLRQEALQDFEEELAGAGNVCKRLGVVAEDVRLQFLGDALCGDQA